MQISFQIFTKLLILMCSTFPDFDLLSCESDLEKSANKKLEETGSVSKRW